MLHVHHTQKNLQGNAKKGQLVMHGKGVELGFIVNVSKAINVGFVR